MEILENERKSKKEEQIKIVSEQRKEQFKELDKKILNCDKSLRTQESLLTYQPILGISLSPKEKVDDFKKMSRILEMRNKRDAVENRKIVDYFTQEFIEVCMEKFRKAKRMEEDNIQKEFATAMEITRGFCYIKSYPSIAENYTLWSSFRNVNNELETVSNWTSAKGLFDALRNLNQTYDLTDKEKINLFANNVCSCGITSFLNVFLEEKNWNVLKKDLNLNDEGIKELDEAILFKMRDNSFLNYKNFVYSLARLTPTLKKETCIESLNKMRENGLKKTTAFLTGRFTAMDFQLGLGNDDKELFFELLRNSTSGENKYILIEFRNKLKNEFRKMNIDENEVMSLLKQQEDIENEIFIGGQDNYNVWYDFIIEVDKCESDYENIDIENIFRNGIIVNQTFFEHLKNCNNNKLLAAAGYIFPSGLPVIYNLSSNKKEFIEIFLNNGGSLESISDLEREYGN